MLQKQQRVGIDEVVAHSNRPDFVANTDPELRMWDALDAGTHDDTPAGCHPGPHAGAVAPSPCQDQENLPVPGCLCVYLLGPTIASAYSMKVSQAAYSTACQSKDSQSFLC